MNEKNIDVGIGSKKILFLGRFFFPALGGGEFFLHKVLKYLKSNGYFVYSACYCNPNEIPFSEDSYVEWDGIPVFQLKPDGDFIEKFIKKTCPDIVVTQSFDAPRIIDAAKSVGAKTILGTHFWRNICAVDQYFANMLTRDISSLRLLTENHRVFFEADEVYVNSKFMQLALKRFTGFDCKNIIHPTIDLDRVLVKNRDPKYITLINPDEGKGGDLFVLLAERLKGLNFMCVGKGNGFHSPNRDINAKLSKMLNVKIVEQTKDMSKIYEQTKILLIPSRVDETFSMVALEAMFNGIPVIASNNGNLPYLLQGCGFNLPVNNPDLWEETIDTLNHNQEFYQEISKRSISESKKYLPETELNKFKELIIKCLRSSMSTTTTLKG